MIEADIRGKLGSEDTFTSCCIGLLELLPDYYLLSFLQKAVNICGCSLNLDTSLSIKTLDFWPSFLSGYPDVVVALEDNTILIIEIKHGAGKHGSDSTKQDSSNSDLVTKIDENLKNGTLSSIENNGKQTDEEDKKTRDQLAKYWCDARRKYPSARVSLIYLTHHRSIPKNDLMESEKSAKLQCGGSDLYWLNWFTLYYCIAHDWSSDSVNYYSEKKIFELLQRYLAYKKYVCFLRWGSFPTVSVFPSYIKFYNWTATGLASDLASIVYNKTYNFGRRRFYGSIMLPYCFNYDWDTTSKLLADYIRSYKFGLLPIAVKSFYFP